MALARFRWIGSTVASIAEYSELPRKHENTKSGYSFRAFVFSWPADDAGAGFSLLEVLVATTLLAAALAAVAQLFAVATKSNFSAKATTFASLLAQQKMEQLRGLTYGFDVLGLPLTDTTTDITVAPESVTGGKGLSPSPAGTLGQNMSGYCDFLDRNGNSLGGGTTPPAGTAYIRRWSVEPLPT